MECENLANVPIKLANKPNIIVAAGSKTPPNAAASAAIFFTPSGSLLKDSTIFVTMFTSGIAILTKISPSGAIDILSLSIAPVS